ncbi:hypothetical protein [Aliikangiella sp. IMCC44632]
MKLIKTMMLGVIQVAAFISFSGNAIDSENLGSNDFYSQNIGTPLNLPESDRNTTYDGQYTEFFYSESEAILFCAQNNCIDIVVGHDYSMFSLVYFVNYRISNSPEANVKERFTQSMSVRQILETCSVETKVCQNVASKAGSYVLTYFTIIGGSPGPRIIGPGE